MWATCLPASSMLSQACSLRTLAVTQAQKEKASSSVQARSKLLLASLAKTSRTASPPPRRNVLHLSKAREAFVLIFGNLPQPLLFQK